MPRRSARLAAKAPVDYRAQLGMSTKSKKKVAKLSVPVKRAVTAIVKGNMESKYSFNVLNSTSFNSGIATTADWYNCLPNVKTGTSPFQRIGTRIQPTSLKMSWVIGYNNEVDRSCDNYVVLYVFKMKRFKNFDDMVANGDAAAFLDQGVGGLVGFDGYTQQLITPVNNEQFTLLHKKVIHLQKGIGFLNNNLPPADSWYAGNGNKSSAIVNITVKPGKLIYDEDNSASLYYPGQPNNFGLVWAIGYAHADASSPDSLRQDIQVTQTSSLYYKDA